MKLGFIDWGIGGLSVLKNIQSKNINCSGIYVSDSGSTPYGMMAPDVLKERLFSLFDFLLLKDCTHIIVACNAASTVVMDKQSHGTARVINVISPTIESLALSSFKKLGVIGGDRTVNSHAYLEIQKRSSIQIVEQSAQPLSAMIELGQISWQDTNVVVKNIIDPLVENQVEGVVMACTHYPALQPVFEMMYPQIHWIDPADYICNELDVSTFATTAVRGEMVYYTSGDPLKMREAAFKAFQFDLHALPLMKG